jgi:periplasmic divalent cation tolerance protein
MKYIQVITTTDKRSTANTIANALVKKRLAACVQTWPISSTFKWKGKVMNGKEWIILIKAREPSYEKIEKEIIRIHNYEVPEIISLPILKGSKSYLDWIEGVTKPERR